MTARQTGALRPENAFGGQAKPFAAAFSNGLWCTYIRGRLKTRLRRPYELF
ncbi:hypothetical protein HMPREF9123_0681 [Neisseria bacilliformis ATCC BAA-1200]|uniref:Uncharacterized protein n=1 Tax=Neisseria bacilliformis ATCC BAA-1200 TaxID=888742 RepID=F2BAA5_9NEIS|nr:hypothetical protein HMPREF9123_0681 [Neisseria bacilliformis ATCC BAA-1200]